MKNENILKVKREILFIIFFVLSVVKIGHSPNINKFIGAFDFFIMILVFIFIFFIQKKWKIYFKKYKFEIVLTCFLFFILFLSLCLHYNDYKNLKFFIIYGISTIVVFSTLPISWLIFNATEKKTFLAEILFIIIHLIALGKYLNISFFNTILTYTVAADILKSNKISSVFRWYTIYGTFSALTLLYSLIYFIQAKSKKEKFIYLILSIFSLIGGSLSNSRNFFITFIFGFFFLILIFLKRKIFQILIYFFVFITIFHLIVYNIPSISKRYSLIFPYFKKLHHPEKIKIKDFIPKINTSSLSGRNKIWKKAINLWKKSKIIGIGPGNFRIHSHLKLIHNVHNFFLQILVESGIIGFILLLLIVIKLIYNIKFSIILPIFVAVITALNFDNYLDHSIGWVISVAFMLQPLKNEKN